MNTYLGIELGSTRIKAVTIDENFDLCSSGSYTWSSKNENGIWTYDLSEAINGFKNALSQIENRDLIKCVGISGMMHGYLVFDKDWNLLTPFRTWQNTISEMASNELTKLFNFNIPQRWSVSNLYQAVLNNEPHVKDIAHLTTLSGYIHYLLTGVDAVGIGEASGMFPIDFKTKNYDEEMLLKFDNLLSSKKLPWKLKDILPDVLIAGESAGNLTEEGAKLLDGLLNPGIRFAPPEGDGGTGMVATNSVTPAQETFQRERRHFR